MKPDSRPSENQSESNEWHSFKIHLHGTWEAEDVRKRRVGDAGELEGEELVWD